MDDRIYHGYVKAELLAGAGIFGVLTDALLGIVAPNMAVIVSAVVGSAMAIAYKQEHGLRSNVLTFAMGCFFGMLLAWSVSKYTSLSAPVAAGLVAFIGKEIAVLVKTKASEPGSFLDMFVAWRRK